MHRRRLLTAALSTAALAATPRAVLADPAQGGARQRAERPPEKLSAEQVEARRRFFGIENVDQRGRVRRDRVMLAWFGVSGFAMALRGQVVLLDAWVPRGTHSGYVPTSVEELAALRPSAIFIGHGHFDHAADAGVLAAATGATVVGTAAHGQQAQEDAGDTDISTLTVFDDDADLGDTRELDLVPGVAVTAVTHPHSAAEPPDLDDPGAPHRPVAPPPDPRTMAENPPEPEDTRHLLEHASHDEGGCVLYHFRVGGFSVTWHDTVGPLPEEAPGGVADVLASLPPTDVHLGAIQGFGQLTNGMRDPRLYIEALRPTLFVPHHHDDWLAGITTRGENYESRLREELEHLDEADRPHLRFLYDPGDYVRPEVLTFDIDAPVWRQ